MSNAVLHPPKTKVPADRPLARQNRIVVALGDGPDGQGFADVFRRNGWEVHLAPLGPDARRVIRSVRPRASVLPAAAVHGESGWLVCRKLLMERPTMKVVLVADRPNDRDQRMADFVGATAIVPFASPACAISRLVGANVRTD